LAAHLKQTSPLSYWKSHVTLNSSKWRDQLKRLQPAQANQPWASVGVLKKKGSSLYLLFSKKNQHAGTIEKPTDTAIWCTIIRDTMYALTQNHIYQIRIFDEQENLLGYKFVVTDHPIDGITKTYLQRKGLLMQEGVSLLIDMLGDQ
jgi:hypothetical protein